MQKFVLGILVGVTCLVVAGLSGCGDETCIQEMAAASLDSSSGLARHDTGHTGAGHPDAVLLQGAANPAQSLSGSAASAGSPVAVGESAIRGKGIAIDEPQMSDGLPAGAVAQKNAVDDALPEMEPAVKQGEVAQAQKTSTKLAEIVKPTPARGEVLAAADKKGENVPGLENFSLGTDIALPEMPAGVVAKSGEQAAKSENAKKETVESKDSKKADNLWREEMLELVPAVKPAKSEAVPGTVTIAEEVSGEKVTVAPAARNEQPVAVAAVVKDLPAAPAVKTAAIADESAAEPAAAKAEEAKPAEAAAKTEEAKPAEAAAKTEEAKPVEAAAKTEETKPAEAAVKAEEAKPAEVAKKVEETKPAVDQKAELVRLEKIRQEARQTEARNSYDTGVKYFNAGQYQEALNFFDKAVQADPGLQDAVTMRTKARQLTGRTDNVEDDSQLMNEISRNQAARLRERELSINNSLQKATAYYISAINPDSLRRSLPRNEQIKLGLDDLELAAKEAQAAEQLLQGAGLAKSAESTLSMRIKAFKAQVTEAGRSLTEERGMIDRREAQAKADAQKQNVTEQQSKEVDQLFAGVDLAVSRTEYDKALEAVNKIIALDPNNKKAYEKRDQIERLSHQATELDTKKELEVAQNNWSVDIKEAGIMPKKMLIYPLDWERIQQRAKTANMGNVVDFERQRIITALSNVTGTVEYTELPLNMVMEDFRRRAKVNIMLNPEVDQNMSITITLRGVSLWVAFETILKSNELEFSVKDQAIEIFKKGSGGSADAVLKIFQVADLTTPKKNYYAPKISAGEEGADWGDDDDDDDDDDDEWAVKQVPLKEQIKKYVTPEKWDNPAYSVELWDDNLLVRATPEILGQVSKFLDKLRESAKLQVFVEGRFMDITDDFSEYLGFDWSSAYTDSNSDKSRMLQGGLSVTRYNTASSYVTSQSNSNSGLHTNVSGMWGSGDTNPVGYLMNSLGLNLTIDAIQSTKKGSVLHNPKVLVANGRNAYARVIVIERYMTSYTITGTNVLPVVTELPQGVTWDVRPIVSFDRKYITIRVRPRMEELDTENGMNQPFNFGLVSDSTTTVGGTATSNTYWWQFTLTYPVTRQTLFETNATVPDGGTLLIGGQLRENSSDSVTGIPILTSIPGAGRLFRSNQKERSGTNRVIMVSAKIVELED